MKSSGISRTTTIHFMLRLSKCGMLERSGNPDLSGQMPLRNMSRKLHPAVYKYSGKQWDDDFGLDWYWFGPGRFQDPAVGR